MTGPTSRIVVRAPGESDPESDSDSEAVAVPLGRPGRLSTGSHGATGTVTAAGYLVARACICGTGSLSR